MLNLITLCTLLLAHGYPTQAQQPEKIPRVGFLSGVRLRDLNTRVEAFRQGLRELGYVEGKNIVIEWREANGSPDRLRELAAELVRQKVDVIVSPGPLVTRPLREATTTIPIVMAQDTDPVGSGFIVNLARPGGNITGLATLAPDIGGKQLEVLKEIVPRLSRVAIIGNSTIPGNAQALRETVVAAGSIDIYLRYLDVLAPTDIERVFQVATKGHVDGVMVLGNPVLNPHRKQIVELAAKYRLPAAYTRPEFIDAGGLMYYGTSYNDLLHRAASYVDKILKGAKPADLPVELPTKFDLVINMKTAKALGLKIPSELLMEADKVIE
jgi:putative ABC transport system substrate-binding protein